MQKNHRGMCADALSLIINLVLSPLNLICMFNLTRIWKIINKCISEVILSRNILESLNGKAISQFSSIAQSCPTLCYPLDCSTPGFHLQLPEFTQTHVHWVGDAIQPSHSLLSPSPPAFNLSQHQGLFKWVCSSHQVAKVLEFQLQHQSFQRIFRTDFL